MTPAQERQMQLDLADLRNRLEGLKPSSDAQLAKAAADLEKTNQEIEAAKLRMEAEKFKLEREKKEAADCDAAGEITPKVVFAALLGCIVLGLGGVVAKLG